MALDSFGYFHFDENAPSFQYRNKLGVFGCISMFSTFPVFVRLPLIPWYLFLPSKTKEQSEMKWRKCTLLYFQYIKAAFDYFYFLEICLSNGKRYRCLNAPFSMCSAFYATMFSSQPLFFWFLVLSFKAKTMFECFFFMKVPFYYLQNKVHFH